MITTNQISQTFINYPPLRAPTPLKWERHRQKRRQQFYQPESNFANL